MAARQRDSGGTRAYYVLDKAQLRCIASPPRQDMVDHFSAHGALSVREVAAAIGRKPASIYHHLKQLLAVGLVVEAGSRVTHRRREKLYATPARRMRLNKALQDRANDEEMRGIVAALCRQTERDFARGLDNADARRGGARQNLRVFRLVNRPSAQSMQLLNRKLDEIAEILWREPDPGSPAVSLTWVMTPTASADDD